MRLPVLIGVVTLALMGTGSAQAHHRTDDIVFDSAGNLQPDALEVAADITNDLPLHNQTSWFLNQTTTIGGQSYAAGKRLSKTEYAALISEYPSSSGDSWLDRVTGTRPTGAIETTRQTAATAKIEKGRRAGGRFPSIRALGNKAIVASGPLSLALAATVLGEQTIRLLLGDDGDYTTVPSSALRWTYCANNTGLTAYDLPNEPHYRITAGASASDCANHAEFQPWGGSGYHNPDAATASAAWEVYTSSAATMTLAPRTDSTTTYTAGSMAVVIYRTPEQHEEAMAMKPGTQEDYDNHANQQNLGSFNPGPMTSTEITNITNNLGEAGAQSNTQKDAEDAIREAVAPGSVPAGEGLPNTTTVTGTVTIIPPATTVPSAPAVDFSPVSNIDFGCKFPYGFICYAVDFTEQFDVTGDAPAFTFDFPTVSVSGNEYGGGGDYTVDLEVVDDYMELWRGILTVVLWVGAIYLVATRMLGVKFGGDPGEAIDDVL